MAKYIDCEAAVKFFLDIAAAGRTSYNIMLLAVARTIAAFPAADVRPVVKAKWVYTDMSRLVCSNCGNPVAFALKADRWHEGDFCPNCGARMEES